MANASEIFENLSRTFSKTADRMAKKTDEFISVQKVKNKKNTLENQVNSTYRTIGKIMFAEYAAGEFVSEEIAELCEKIEGLQKQIEECTSQIADIKGVQICESCGAPVPNDAEFCMKCGTRKAEVQDVEDADFTEIEDEIVEETAEESEDEE